VDEAEDEAAVVVVEQAVVVVEAGGEVAHAGDEVGCGVVEVVEVDFDVHGAVLAEPGYGVEEVALVLLLRIESGEAGRTSGGVFGRGGGDGGPALLPLGHAFVGDVERGVSVGLEVVGKGDPEALRGASRDGVTGPVAKVGGEPEFQVFRKIHEGPMQEGAERMLCRVPV